MKKFISLILSALCICTAAFTGTACKKRAEEPSAEIKNGYLALNAYEITLKEGESFALDAKLYDENDEERTIQSLTYSVDADPVAKVENGVITAKKAGETSVSVYADGYSSACFVSVSANDALNGLVIRLLSHRLYQGVQAQAYAQFYKDGVFVAEPVVKWSTDDESVLFIGEDGILTPKTITSNAKITATCTYDGEAYTAVKEVEIVEPVYYAFNKENITLASEKTASGKENSAYTQTRVAINRIHLTNGTVEKAAADEYSVSVINEEVATAEKAADNAVLVKAKSAGETVLRANIGNAAVFGKIVVSKAIAGIEDMDALAIACFNDKSLLAENYLLVSDIDYGGEVMLPIAPFIDNVGKRSLGIQWKYRLKKTKNGYAFVDRADFGKTGTGLTDAEFADLIKLGGINRNNAAYFTGTFDGNGYSIKNGKLFYGVSTLNSDADSYYASYSSLFGCFSGTLKNVSFENIGIQNPESVIIEDNSFGLDRICLSATDILDGVLRKTEEGNYIYRCASIIGIGLNCKVENAFLEMREKEVVFINNCTMGGLICWASGAVSVKNCVVDIRLSAYLGSDWRIYSIKGTGDRGGLYENNLSVGTVNAIEGMDGKLLGQNGNLWVSSSEWKKLFTLSQGVNATNAKNCETVVKSFDGAVWDTSAFGADKDGRPALIKGCSVA